MYSQYVLVVDILSVWRLRFRGVGFGRVIEFASCFVLDSAREKAVAEACSQTLQFLFREH